MPVFQNEARCMKHLISIFDTQCEREISFQTNEDRQTKEAQFPSVKLKYLQVNAQPL